MPSNFYSIMIVWWAKNMGWGAKLNNSTILRLCDHVQTLYTSVFSPISKIVMIIVPISRILWKLTSVGICAI